MLASKHHQKTQTKSKSNQILLAFPLQQKPTNWVSKVKPTPIL
jgi:hypothetical protein